MAHIIKNAKQVNKKSRTHQVEEIAPGVYCVTSGTSGKKYTVRLQAGQKCGSATITGATCTCRWAQYRKASDPRSGCSHAQAAIAWVEKGETGKSVSAWASLEDAQRQKRHILVMGDGLYLTTRVGG